jgi:TctA family transporter
MKRYAIVLAPALAGALFGASLTAILVKPADAEAVAAIRSNDAAPMASIAAARPAVGSNPAE